MNSLFKLKKYIKPHIGTLLVSAALGIPLAALRVSPVPLVKYIVDDLLVSRDTSKLVLFPALVIAVFSINFIVRFFHFYLLRKVVIRVNQKVRFDLYRHALGLSADHYTIQSTGELMSRVGSDPQHIDGGLSTINILIREPLTFLILFGYALYLNWELTFLIVIIFPLLAWVFSATGKYLKKYIHQLTEENAKVFSALQESFTGIRVIKAFKLEKYLENKFSDRIDTFSNHQLKISKVQEASHPMVELCTAFAIAGVIYFGGSMVLSNQMSSGDLLAFFTAFALMMDPIRKLNDVNIKIHQASAACDRIFDLLSWKSKIIDPSSPIELKTIQKNIRFNKVSFSYPDEPSRIILKDINFTIERNKTLALIGRSGAGKSSIAHLLPRVFDVTQGEILFDGIDIKNLALSNLRELVAIVSQDIFLFNDSIKENIRCGKLDATDNEIIIAAQRAHVTDFIKLLPKGIDTVIGDRGMKLSGGEKQRLSIARAFLKNAPVLILDEATSNLDASSERKVQEALNGLMQNKTTMIIAHRLSTIKTADKIIVLRNGTIIESGQHKDLMKLNGEYAHFQKLNESTI